MGRKTQTQLEATRQAILESAMQTLALHPKASMAQIAGNAGVGRATLNRHVSSRSELIIELSLLAIRQTAQACESIDYSKQPSIDALAQTFHAIAPLGSRFAFLVAQPESYDVPEVDQGLQEQKEFMLDLVRTCQAQGSLRKDLSATWINAVIDALIYATWNEVSGGTLSKDEAGSRMLDMLLHGCGKSG